MIKNNSQIQINDSHIFGYEIRKGVAIGGEDSGNISFSNSICKYISDLIKNGENIDYIVDCVDKKVSNATQNMVNMITHKQYDEGR